MEQAVESLRRLIPGVFGRIVDLATPKNTKHNLAMAVAIGKHMDSVVVQDERTALHCIQYLKEQRIGVLTFIPLDAKTKPLDERLRGLGKSKLLLLFQYSYSVLSFKYLLTHFF
jgi:structural maintenance of chromosome 1